MGAPEIQFEGPTQEDVGTSPEVPTTPTTATAVVAAPLTPSTPFPPPPPGKGVFESPEPEELLEVVLKEAPKAPKPSKVVISLDNTPSEVISLEEEGVSLFFEDEPGRFLELEEAVLRKLSKDNLLRYTVSSRAYEKQVRHQADPSLVATTGLTVAPRKVVPPVLRHDSATARMHVEGKPGMHYFWPLASEVGRFEQDGAKVTTDPDVKTYGKEVGSSRRIVRFGEVEHVLMEVPETVNQARLNAIGDKSKSRGAKLEEATKVEILKGGGIPLDPSTKPSAPWGRIDPPSTS